MIESIVRMVRKRNINENANDKTNKKISIFKHKRASKIDWIAKKYAGKRGGGKGAIKNQVSEILDRKIMCSKQFQLDLWY